MGKDKERQKQQKNAVPLSDEVRRQWERDKERKRERLAVQRDLLTEATEQTVKNIS